METYPNCLVASRGVDANFISKWENQTFEGLLCPWKSFLKIGDVGEKKVNFPLFDLSRGVIGALVSNNKAHILHFHRPCNWWWIFGNMQSQESCRHKARATYLFLSVFKYIQIVIGTLSANRIHHKNSPSCSGYSVRVMAPLENSMFRELNSHSCFVYLKGKPLILRRNIVIGTSTRSEPILSEIRKQ